MHSQKIDVSIILPCYNVSSFVEESVRQIREVLDATIFSYEIIFVDDKSTDDTIPLVKKIIAGKENCSLYTHDTNRGRGRAVMDGFEKSRGEIIGFIDTDLDNPARYIFSMICGIKNGHTDVCTALRVYQWKFNFWFLIRMLASKGYAWLSGHWLGTKLRDTETGCKFFLKSKIQPILKEIQAEDWFWDTEIMTRAHYEGLKIFEIPTLFIRNTHLSTMDLFPETLRYICNLIKFKKTSNELRKRWLHRQEKSLY
jgi:glycosyltransferase involved in cell wall biosynthesis